MIKCGKRLLAVITTFAITFSTVFSCVSLLSAAEKASGVSVVPLKPLRASALGDFTAETSVSNRLFTATDVAVAKSDNALTNQSIYLDGFCEAYKDVSSVLLYLNLKSENTITVAASFYDEYYANAYSQGITLGKSANYYVLSRGASNWTKKSTVAADNGTGGIKFDKAFEGYVKIPIDSFDMSSKFAVLYAIDSIKAIELSFQKLGGSYGDVSVAPFLITTDDGGVDFAVANGYKAPDPKCYEKLIVDPVYDMTRRNTNAATITTTTVSPLDFTSALGISMVPKDAPYEKEDVSSSQAYAGFEFNDMSISGYSGIVAYVKTDAANVFMPEIDLTHPGGRWTYDYNPILTMTVGTVYEYRSINDETWHIGKTIAGKPGDNTHWGAIDFSGPFEGYVKLPFSSFLDASDSGYFVLSDQLDTIKYIHLKLKGLGGKYGNATLGPLFMIKQDGFSGMEISDSDPILVTPISDLTKSVNSAYVKADYIKPFDFTDVNGLKMESASGVLTSDDGNINASRATATLKSAQALDMSAYKNVTDLIFYVKTDSANTIMPVLNFKRNGKTYEWSLHIGDVYQYLPLGGTAWKNGITEDKGNTAVNNGAVYATRKCFGTISFDGAFEGYVKVSVASFRHPSIPNPNNLQFESDLFESFWIKSKYLGGEYGSVSFAPLFLVNKAGGSAALRIFDPETDIPKEKTSVEVSPIEIKSAEGSDVTMVNPIDKISLNGVKFKAAGTAVTLNFEQSSATGSGILFYLDTAKCKVLPEMTLQNGKKLSLGAAVPYEIMEYGGNSWTALNSGILTGGKGTLNFENSFKGYIKIPYSSFIGTEVQEISSSAISSLSLKFSDTESSEKNITAGPAAIITKDGNSGDIQWPTKYLPSDPMERARYILANSKNGIATANYYCVGDSTRAMIGSPVFRLTRDVLHNQYNANCILQAKSGQKTEHWSEHTPKLQGRNPTVSNLIAQIPGTGRNSIVEISLGINDATPSQNTSADVAAFLKEGIAKLKEAKPDAVIIYTSPNLIGENNWNTKLREAAATVWEDKTIGKIDVTNGVMEDYYATYYADNLHPTVKGYSAIAKFILSNYFPQDYTYEKIVVTDPNLITLPAGAKLVNTGFSTIGLNTSVSRMRVNVSENGKTVNTYAISVSAKSTEFSLADNAAATSRYIMRVNDVSFKDGVILYVRSEGANSFALSAFTQNGKERMLRAYQYYEYMRVGETEWKIGKTVLGKPDNDNYGSVKFDNSFEGFIYLPTSSFYNYKQGDEFVELNFRYQRLNKSSQFVMAPFITAENIVPLDGKTLALPKDADLITDDVIVSNSLNLASLKVKMNVGGTQVSGFYVNGTKEANVQYPFVGSKNFIEMNLAKPLIGNGYITFYLSLPAANDIGLTAFKDNNKKELIFKAEMPYQILPDGKTEWINKVSGWGKDPQSEAYGSIHFDSAFSGFVRLPISCFHNSPTIDDEINHVTLRFAKLGGSYGEVKVGAFLAMSDKPYIASGVWDKSVLPEMVPFTPPTKFDGYATMRDIIPSPIPSLSTNKSLRVSASPTVDKGKMGIGSSHFWVSQSYDSMSMKGFSHLVFYIKVPKAQDNYLAMCLFDDKKVEFKPMANEPYQLMALGENKWSHSVAYKFKNNYGGIEFPAGFEGLLKIPITSLVPKGKINAETKLSEITYRFAYIGTGDDSIIVGPVFGVTKDNDTGAEDIVFKALPEKTTIKSIYSPDKNDIFKDRIMLYWEAFPGADHYLIEAYSITKTDNGVEYRLVSEKTAFTNSGTIGGLEPGTQYAILVKARSLSQEVLAVYDFTVITTAKEEPYAGLSYSDKIAKYDSVYYNAAQQTDTNEKSIAVPIAITAGAAAIAVAAVFGVCIYRRRRQPKNEK